MPLEKMGMDRPVASERVPHRVIIGIALSFVLGLMGAALGGYLGWYFAGSGLKVIIGAFFGFAINFVIAFSVTGPLQYYLNRMLSYKDSDLERVRTIGLASFDLYVTVHQVKNIHSTGAFMGLLGQVRNHYVEVKVGRVDEQEKLLSVQRNPVKRTCVNQTGAFEECFHFVISPTDDTVRFILYDQEVFKDMVIAQCDVHITDEVISAGFPQRKTLRMLTPDVGVEAGLKDMNQLAGNLVVSFSHGADFPEAAIEELQQKSRLAYSRMREAQEQLVSKTEAYGHYGTWATTGPQAAQP